MASAKAQVSAARSSLEQAELSLARTQIKAPFDAQIQNIYVNLGSQVNVGDNLADLVGVEHYWIESTLPINQLAWLNQPQEGVNIEVKIEDRLAWPEDTFRTGRLVSIMGQVDDNTRMARVLIEVNDPIGIKNNSLPKLTLGAFVNTHIPAKELTDVARIDRKYVRKNDTLWLMVNDQLNIKQLNVVFRDEQYFYVSDTLNAGDQMVTTDLSRVIEGAPLRLNKGQPNER